MAHPAQIKAAEIYGQDRDLTDSEQAFLLAVDQASQKFVRTLDDANRDWGGGSRAWEAVKNLSERSRDKAYQAALDAFNADYDDEIETVSELMAAE